MRSLKRFYAALLICLGVIGISWTTPTETIYLDSVAGINTDICDQLLKTVEIPASPYDITCSVYFERGDPGILLIDSIVTFFHADNQQLVEQIVYYEDTNQVWREYCFIRNYTYRERWALFKSMWNQELFERHLLRARLKFDYSRYKQEVEYYATWQYFNSWLHKMGLPPILYEDYLMHYQGILARDLSKLTNMEEVSYYLDIGFISIILIFGGLLAISILRVKKIFS